jgi:hypothetical protein
MATVLFILSFFARLILVFLIAWFIGHLLKLDKYIK